MSVKCLKRKIKRILLSLSLIFFIGVIPSTFIGCDSDKYSYLIYYGNEDMTEMTSTEYKTNTDDKVVLAKELIGKLSEPQKSDKYKDISFGDLKGCNIADDKITVNFAQKPNMKEGQALMCRAALVKTLSQIDGVKYVSIQFNGNPAEYTDGTVVGVLSLDDFIDDDNQPVESIEWKEISLYYAASLGDKLKKTTTYVAYNKNTTLEKLVVDKLIKGPTDNSANPTLSSNVKLLNISVNKDICYVNFNSAFLSDMVNVSAEVTIYSIVDSLCSIDGISQVKILVNGDSSKRYKESIDLENSFSFNDAIVQTGSDY